MYRCNLLGGDRNGLVLLGLESGRPDVERLGVVRLQRLDPGHIEPDLGGVLLDQRDRRQPTAGKDLGEDELDERITDINVGSWRSWISFSLGMTMVCSNITPSRGIRS